MKHAFFLVALISVAVLASCQKDDTLEEELPESNQMALTAEFEDRVHPTSGTAKLVEIDGTYFLELSDFKTDSGPALKVYLSKEENPNNFIDLGDLKATSGTFNYEIPSSTQLEDYPHALIWCERFSVLFGVATFVH